MSAVDEQQGSGRRRFLARGIAALSVTALSIAAACSLGVSPGDYAQGGEPDATTTQRPPVPAGGARLLLLSGWRGRFDPNDANLMANTWGAILREDGTVGDFYHERTPPIVPFRFTQAFFDQGRLMTVTQGDGKVLFAPVDTAAGGLTGDWGVLDPDGSVQASSSGLLTRPTVILAAGGKEEIRIDGGTQEVWNGRVFTATFDVAARNPGTFVKANAELTAARGQPVLLLHKDHLLAIGGGREDLTDTIDVARLGPDGVPGAFAATTPLPKPMMLPGIIVVGNKLFVVGGLVTAPGSSPPQFLPNADSYVATIHDDGKLDAFSPIAPLPQSLVLGALFAHKNKLYYLGGVKQAAATEPNVTVDTMYAMDLSADGTPVGGWREIGKLPTPRGGFAAVIFP